MEREPIGIHLLDVLMDGGFPKNSVVLLSGAPGTGKSTLARHFIYSGAKKYEQNCAYVSLKQKIPEIYEESKQMGMDFKELEKKGRVKFSFFNIAARSIPENETHIGMLKKEVKSFGADRLVIDSLNPLADFPISFDELIHYGLLGEMDKVILPTIREDLIVRMQVHKLMMTVKELGCTSIIISEVEKDPPWMSDDGVSEFLADGIILMGRNKSERFLTIEKMRKTKHALEAVPFEITSAGIHIKE